MMDEMLNQRAPTAGRRPTVLNKNDAYSPSSNYTQNIAYNQSHRHSQNCDDPSVTYYYSTNSAAGNCSQSPPQDSSPNTEHDTIGNYTQNVAYKRTSGGADDPEDAVYYYSTNTAYEANAHGPYEINVAYGVRLEDRTEEEEEEDGEIDYYYGTNDRQDPEPSSGFAGDIEVHYEVYRHS